MCMFVHVHAGMCMSRFTNNLDIHHNYHVKNEHLIQVIETENLAEMAIIYWLMTVK
jgi:hypothetical protein